MSFQSISIRCSIALLLTLSACIPSKSETETAAKPKETVATAPAPAPKAPEAPKAAEVPAAAPAPTPATDAKSAPAEGKDESSNIKFSLAELDKIPTADEFDESDPIAVAKRLNEQAMNNGGVRVYTSEDGVGFNVDGANGLTATIKPNPSGKGWIFDGAFIAKTEGLKVGKEQVIVVNDGLPTAEQGNTIQNLYMIVIPIQLPDINAIETGDTYTTPVHFDLSATPDAQFVVNTMPTKNL